MGTRRRNSGRGAPVFGEPALVRGRRLRFPKPPAPDEGRRAAGRGGPRRRNGGRGARFLGEPALVRGGSLRFPNPPPPEGGRLAGGGFTSLSIAAISSNARSGCASARSSTESTASGPRRSL